MKNKTIKILLILTVIGSLSITGCIKNTQQTPSNQINDASSDQNTKESTNKTYNLAPSHFLNISTWSEDNHHMCYLACTTMIVNYYNTSLWFDDVITYTGVATGFTIPTQKTTEEKKQINPDEDDDDYDPYDKEDDDEGEEQGLINNVIISTVVKNLGYTPHITYTLPARGMTYEYTEQITNQQQITNKTILLTKIKEQITSNNPLLTWFDNKTIWETYFPSIKVHAEPLIINGYDENAVYATVATDGLNSTNTSIPYDDFFNGWKETSPFFIHFLKNNTGKKPITILVELRQYAEKAIPNLKACAKGLKNGSLSLGEPGDLGSLATSFGMYAGLRKNLAAYFDDHEYDIIAEFYKKSAVKFETAYEISDHDDKPLEDVAEIINEIANIEQEALNHWPTE